MSYRNSAAWAYWWPSVLAHHQALMLTLAQKSDALQAAPEEHDAVGATPSPRPTEADSTTPQTFSPDWNERRCLSPDSEEEETDAHATRTSVHERGPSSPKNTPRQSSSVSGTGSHQTLKNFSVEHLLRKAWCRSNSASSEFMNRLLSVVDVCVSEQSGNKSQSFFTELDLKINQKQFPHWQKDLVKHRSVKNNLRQYHLIEFETSSSLKEQSTWLFRWSFHNLFLNSRMKNTIPAREKRKWKCNETLSTDLESSGLRNPSDKQMTFCQLNSTNLGNGCGTNLWM